LRRKSPIYCSTSNFRKLKFLEVPIYAVVLKRGAFRLTQNFIHGIIALQNKWGAAAFCGAKCLEEQENYSSGAAERKRLNALYP
jgi:hypothetical protein